MIVNANDIVNKMGRRKQREEEERKEERRKKCPECSQTRHEVMRDTADR